MKLYEGFIVEESLDNIHILKSILIIGSQKFPKQNLAEGRHVLHVKITRKQISELKHYLKKDWYIHFWYNNEILVIYKDKMFSIDYQDESTWQKCIEYGISIGIPEEDIDFPIV